ncbi:DUF1178 family protein [Aquabacter spiritensis]|uniref:Uncharacterized protein n=1 Tax=Aquabacter spiritensis TaxID=933073 RepID=A0A4R3LUP4_9HYPH|nr:DUF1178 family protein [Aquabacter spiritensis]TCT04320.1 hypothetical protein EDC64_107137 [Aquabacter spiritensis]
MIRYALTCAQGHAFESWFPSSDSYERQRALGLVACPTCGVTAVEKAIMAPSVARTDRGARAAAEPEAPRETTPAPVAMMGEGEQEFRRLLRGLRDHVTRTADYVGDDFATLARKMHEGEVEQRSIYGEATPDEVKSLREDEVEVFPLPVLPEDRN